MVTMKQKTGTIFSKNCQKLKLNSKFTKIGNYNSKNSTDMTW